MNTIKLQKIKYKYGSDGVESEELHFQTEFVVDGVGLSSLFNFESDRPWFGQTEFETGVDHIDELKGLKPPENQLNNDHFVLYRCHCGCDYCGVISCRITHTESSVRWSEITYGDESGGFEFEDDDEPGITIGTREFEFS